MIIGSSPQNSGGGGDAAGQGTATVGQQQADDDPLQDMRGWLMAAATLFLGMAYQAATKPPAWMPSAKDAFDVAFFGKDGGGPAAGSSVTKKLALRALAHLVLNTTASAISLELVVLLPTMSRATPWLREHVIKPCGPDARLRHRRQLG